MILSSKTVQIHSDEEGVVPKSILETFVYSQDHSVELVRINHVFTWKYNKRIYSKFDQGLWNE